ncbi:MAG TPA: zf-HC2 domain-containing protein [Anaeromyxobacter sp.]|nr:zf-HC2 domain-containing protein [Anaeromyxobacter sp.]
MPLESLRSCSCREAGERLSELLDGELGALDRARLTLHLAACPRCAIQAADLAETVQALHRRGGWASCLPGRRARRR